MEDTNYPDQMDSSNNTIKSNPIQNIYLFLGLHNPQVQSKTTNFLKGSMQNFLKII